MAKCSVVILNWNGKAHLKRFLPSVVDNTPSSVRIIVADNGSTDGSVELVESGFPSVGIISLDSNYGFAGGYNKALKSVDSEYYILLNSDVEVTAGWTEPLIAHMDAEIRCAAAAPKILSYAERNRFEYAGACGGFIDLLGYPFCRGRILSNTEYDHGQYDSPRPIFWASGACMIVRAEVFHSVGGFDCSFFAHMEEIDLCWRIQLAGHAIFSLPASRVYHLGGGTLGNESPRKLYLNFRNNLTMLLKNMPGSRLWWVLPLRLLMDGSSATVYLVTGRPANFKAVFRAHISFYRQVKKTFAKRRIIRSTVVMEPDTIYKGSILWRGVTGRKTFSGMM